MAADRFMVRHAFTAVLVLMTAGRAGAQVLPGPTYDPREMLERVLPAVVTVAVSETGDSRAFGFGEERSPVTTKALQAYAQPLDLGGFVGSGSGFVIERDGVKYVVTNAHVIDTAPSDAISVFSIDRSEYKMRLVGADSYRDIAVLAFVDPPRGELNTVQIHAADDVRVGTPVYAVGNPLGQFPYTITSGIVGGVNRRLSGLTATEGYLQTDATLIWGNSGGPLFGPNGDVVGLNSRIHLIPQLDHFPAPQINFSLEGRHIARLVDDIVAHGRVQRAYVGVALTEPHEVAAAGALRIGEVLAAASPLAPFKGARVLAIGGNSVATVRDALAVMEEQRPGSQVIFKLQTDAGEREVIVTTGTLTPQLAGELGRFTLHRLAGADVVELPGDDGRVIRVVNTPPALDANTSASYMVVDGGLEELADPRQLKTGDKVLYAGYFSEQSQLLFRVHSLLELGVAARLVLPNGWFAIVVQAAEGTYLIDNYTNKTAIF